MVSLGSPFEATPLDFLLQGGALGLLTYVVWWLTRRFNGKIDRLANELANHAVQTAQLQEALRANSVAVRTLSRKLDNRQGV